MHTSYFVCGRRQSKQNIRWRYILQLNLILYCNRFAIPNITCPKLFSIIYFVLFAQTPPALYVENHRHFGWIVLAARTFSIGWEGCNVLLALVCFCQIQATAFRKRMSLTVFVSLHPLIPSASFENLRYILRATKMLITGNWLYCSHPFAPE